MKKHKTYRSKPKRLKKFFTSKFFSKLQTLIVENKVDINLEELKKLQFRDIHKENKDNIILTNDNDINLTELSIDGDKLVKTIIVYELEYEFHPDTQKEFVDKYIWEIPDFFYNDNVGAIEMLMKVRDSILSAKEKKKDINTIINEIDEINLSIKKNVFNFSEMINNIKKHVIRFNIPREEKIFSLEILSDLENVFVGKKTINRIPKVLVRTAKN